MTLSTVMEDALSSLLATVVVREAGWTITVLREQAGLLRSGRNKIACFIMLSGQTCMRADGSELTLGQGDVVVAIGAPTIIIGDATAALTDIHDEESDPVLSWASLGSGSLEAVLIRGEFVIDEARLAFARQSNAAVIAVKAFGGSIPSWLGPLASITSIQDALSGDGAAALSRRLAEVCLIQAIRAHNLRVGDLPRLEQQLDRKINLAVQHLNARPELHWTVGKLATMVGMSRSEFACHFKEVVGDSPVRYLTRVRLALACELLKVDDISIAEVADRTGYGSDIAFIRAFKRTFNLSPSEFRTFCRKVEETDSLSPPGAFPAFVFAV